MYLGLKRCKGLRAGVVSTCEMTLVQSGDPSRVRVDWSGWSASRCSSLLREFEATREEAAQQSKADRQIKGWVFFVGVQDQADAGLFDVVDYRLICCLSAKMPWPSKQ